MSEATDQDVRQIEQLLYLYAWMVDKREWGLIDQVFAADATIDYASTGGPGRMPHREALKWLDGCAQAVAHQSASHYEHHAAGRGGPGPVPLLLFCPHGPAQGRWWLLRAGHRHQRRLLSRPAGAHGARLEDLGARLRDDRHDRSTTGRLQHSGRVGDRHTGGPPGPRRRSLRRQLDGRRSLCRGAITRGCARVQNLICASSTTGPTRGYSSV